MGDLEFDVLLNASAQMTSNRLDVTRTLRRVGDVKDIASLHGLGKGVWNSSGM